MMRFFTLMFSESGGAPSSTRIITAFVVLAVVGTWALISLEKKALQPLSPEQVLLVLGAMGFKVLQRGRENGHSGDTQPPFPVTPK